MVYWELMKKSYLLQLQYRMAHLINNVGSLIFGFVFIAIWTGVLTGKEGISDYKITDMVHYMAFTQCLLWLNAFLSPGLNIQYSVRTGAISIEMARPTIYFLTTVSQECGRLAYNAVYRSLPLGIVFAITVGFYIPAYEGTYFYTLISILLGMLISMNLCYLIGISACWTTEVRWAHLTFVTLLFGLGGQMLPIDFLPGILGKITPYLPFASCIYYPVMIYLEKTPLTPLTSPLWILCIQLGWAILLTLISLGVTRLARKKLEIQGG